LVAGRCECICMHSEAKTFAQRPTVKEPLLSKKNNKGRLKFCRKFNDWTAGVWCKANFSNKALFRLFRTSGNLIVQRRKGECYQESCVMPRVKNPKAINPSQFYSETLPWIKKRHLSLTEVTPPGVMTVQDERGPVLFLAIIVFIMFICCSCPWGAANLLSFCVCLFYC